MKKTGVATPAFFHAAYLTTATRVAIAVINAATAVITFVMYSASSFVMRANHIHLLPWKEVLIITQLNNPCYYKRISLYFKSLTLGEDGRVCIGLSRRGDIHYFSIRFLTDHTIVSISHINTCSM